MLIEKESKQFWWLITTIGFDGYMRYFVVSSSEETIIEVTDQYYDLDVRNVTYEKLELIEE